MWVIAWILNASLDRSKWIWRNNNNYTVSTPQSHQFWPRLCRLIINSIGILWTIRLPMSHLNGVLTNFLMSSPTIFSLIYWYKFLVICISRKEPITTAELSTGNSFKAPQPNSSTLAIPQWTVLISINVNFPKWTSKIWLLLIGSVVASRSEKKDSLWIFNGGRAGYSSRFWCQLWLIFKDQPKRTSNPFRSHSKKYQISAGSISIQYNPSIAHLTEGLPIHPRTRIRS